MSLGQSVWARNGQDSISRQQFVLLMGLFTFLGLGLTAVLAYHTTGWLEMIPAVTEGAKPTYKWHGPINPILFWLAVLVSGLVGVTVALSSEKPLVSLFGFALVAGPFGLLLGPVVGMYEGMSVVKVIVVTMGITGILSLVGAMIPESLESWGGWLFSGLLILLFGSLGIPLLGWLIPGFPVEGALTVADWFGIILFSGYIIYDMNRAMRVPATVDNAVDCALAMYLDIINLFLRLLRQMGQKKN